MMKPTGKQTEVISIDDFRLCLDAMANNSSAERGSTVAHNVGEGCVRLSRMKGDNCEHTLVLVPEAVTVAVRDVTERFISEEEAKARTSIRR